MNKSQDEIVSIWSASYSLEKNSASGGGVTSFTSQAQTCISIVQVIIQLIGLISRLGLGLVDYTLIWSTRPYNRKLDSQISL